ncbi:MAG: hypothetical protein QG602_2033 [Verrucomicrobiota bacterium]|nr:hypothetical protein [Verrucomicrobiota bacterium]
MKSALLGLSLIANIALVAGVTYLVLRPSAPRESEKAASPTAVVVQPAATSPAPAAVDFNVGLDAMYPAERWQSPADIDAWLKSSGAPLNLRYAVLNYLMMEKYKGAITAVRFPTGMKRWQRGSSPPTPEQREKMTALRQQQQREMEAIFGADYAKARFGAESEVESGIPAEKRVEMDRVVRDYMETRMNLGPGNTAKERALLDSEMQKDLAKILTPEEYELHQAYESQEGSRLQQSMRGLDVDDETYLRIFRAAAAAKAASPENRTGSGITLEQLAAIEKSAGAEIAGHIAANQNSTFREISTLYASAGIPSGALLERYRIWNQFHAEAQQFQTGLSGRLTEAQLAQARSYYHRLTEGLSAEARAQFDRTNTGKFMNRLLATK